MNQQNFSKSGFYVVLYFDVRSPQFRFFFPSMITPKVLIILIFTVGNPSLGECPVGVAQPPCLRQPFLQTDQHQHSDSNPALAVGSERSHVWILLAPPVSWINGLSRQTG